MVVRAAAPCHYAVRLGTSFELNLDAAEYVSAPYPAKSLTQAEIEARGLSKADMSQPREPTLRIETTTVDTGERKEFFWTHRETCHHHKKADSA